MAVEILQYALDNIETICDEAGIAGETIAEQIRTAINEAKKLLSDNDFNKTSNSARSKKGK